MNKLYNCSSGGNLLKAVDCLFLFIILLIQAKMISREIKEFKEAKQSTSSVGRTTPQPVSEIPFLILVEKKILECSELHFILIRQDCINRSRSVSVEYKWVACVIHVSRSSFEEHFQNHLFDIKRFHTISRLFTVSFQCSTKFQPSIYKQSESEISNHATHYSELTYHQAFFCAVYFLDKEANAMFKSP